MHLIGSVQGSILHDIYTNADLFLFPGKFETYGMVIAEALATGLPVLAYASEGIKLNFGNHSLCYFQNEEDLEMSLKELLTNTDSYAKIQTAASHHPVFSSWEIAGKEFLQILRRFL
ncbi:MAG: glycosyltransferase [Bacteroidales bacterium]|nr:glycosyltransferase [Bacteroidales bacterium]